MELTDPSIRPFKIDVPDEKLHLLKAKLSHATFPDHVPMSDNWDYGAPISDLKRLISHWREAFDWRDEEAKLNATLPQYTTRIDVDGFGELDIHFVYQRSDRPGSIPLLFCHGSESTVPAVWCKLRADQRRKQGLAVSSKSSRFFHS